MKTAIYLLAGFSLGALTAIRGMMRAAAEVVSFLSLLMAGLLPAMILTATILKGDHLSVGRVRAYTAALTTQLEFWAVMFASALFAAAALVVAKIIHEIDMGVLTALETEFKIVELITRTLTGLSLAALSLIVSRLWEAFKGLRSILILSSQMAELQATVNDKTLAAELQEKAQRWRAPATTRSDWPK